MTSFKEYEKKMLKKTITFAFAALIFTSVLQSTPQYEEEKVISGTKFKSTPSMYNKIEQKDFKDLILASENALEKCGPFTICKGTYNGLTAYVNKENNSIISFLRK